MLFMLMSQPNPFILLVACIIDVDSLLFLMGQTSKTGNILAGNRSNSLSPSFSLCLCYN